MANDDELMASDPMDRLEQKIDALTGAVGKMNTRLGGVESRLGGVESGLRDVKAELADVGTRLTKVEIIAKEADEFSKNVWDSLTSLDEKVTNGFATAKKDNGEQFRLVHAAINKWGERVAHLESPPPPVRRRQR